MGEIQFFSPPVGCDIVFRLTLMVKNEEEENVRMAGGSPNITIYGCTEPAEMAGICVCVGCLWLRLDDMTAEKMAFTDKYHPHVPGEKRWGPNMSF